VRHTAPSPTLDSASASRFGVSRSERIRIAIVYSLILGATAFGFLAAFIIGQISPVLAGLGLVAYAFGLRHGVDADHIVAIDNTTRKLLQDGQRPFTVGMWFSLGHSAIVFILIIALVFATRAIVAELPAVQAAGEIIGLAVSGTFLIVIGLVNVLIVVGIYRVFVDLKKGDQKLNAAELEVLLNKRGGVLNRLFNPLFRLIRRPWHIFPVGFLFGLGFDTATEVALIAISVGIGVSSAVPIWMILILPLMFTCGMVFVDTTDGVIMRSAYGWAFINPIRKVYYNLTVTIVSVVVAFGIGGIEILILVGGRLGLTGPFWDSLADLNFETIGFSIIALFVVAWAFSVAYWKYKRFDERFMASERT
jgi:high-affinity nickel-transport protein